MKFGNTLENFNTMLIKFTKDDYCEMKIEFLFQELS